MDDSPIERAAAKQALAADYDFEEFDDGTSVVERLLGTNQPPRLMLLDWVMPNLGGDEVCKFVRAHERHSDLPIILFTSSRVETDDIVAGFSLGANDYVPKPFAPEELRARVHAVLRGKESRDAALRERVRLAAINRLGRALFTAGADISKIVAELLASLHGLVADGAAITLLPGALPPIHAAVHGRDPSATDLTTIATVTDPRTLSFESSADALSQLPPVYHPYVQKFGLAGLAILPFPIRTPVQGVITLTRDGGSNPFDDDDLAAIETCIEYASLAVQNAARFEAERLARAQLHAVIDHAPIGIVVADAGGRIELVNPTIARMIDGIDAVPTLDALFALGAWTTSTGAQIERATWSFGRSTPGGLLRDQVWFTSRTGDKRIFALTTVTRREVDELVGTVTAIEDVTEVHTMAVERERVAAFQEQMLGIVGHDLRNPLSAIMTGAEVILAYSRDNPKVEAVVGRVQSSGRRMANIVSQLLDVTRARLGGGIPLARTEVQLDLLVETTVEEARAAFPAARFEVTAEKVAGSFDPDRLAQVISNLASNAVQYGDPTQPIRIVVSADELLARITVTNALKDQPVPSEKIATWLEPYRRGEGSPTSHRGGLGLGLYITHEIVTAHRGRLSATSDATGTTFLVELPR